MTKPLPTGRIKRQKKVPTLRECDLMIQGISDKDSIGHLFIVNIEFDQKSTTEKTLLFNEIYMPSFEKKSSFWPTKDLFFNRRHDAKRPRHLKFLQSND